MEELQSQINRIQDELNSLKNSATIPQENYEAIRDRLDASIAKISTNSTPASSETQAVDESGTETYSVAKPMDGFITISFGGINYKIPFYN